MQSIITHLLKIIQYQNQQIRWLVLFISKYLPLGQWAHDDTHSPRYQKFKTDRLPVVQPFIKQDWQFLLAYYEWKYQKKIKPVQRRNGKSIPEDTVCPVCGASHHYLYDNNGGNGQFQCKICGQTFITGERIKQPLKLKCPYCGHALSPIKHRKFLSSINASTITAPTIGTISSRLIPRNGRTTKNTSSNFTISTVSSPWIFLPWIWIHCPKTLLLLNFESRTLTSCPSV